MMLCVLSFEVLFDEQCSKMTKSIKSPTQFISTLAAISQSLSRNPLFLSQASSSGQQIDQFATATAIGTAGGGRGNIIIINNNSNSTALLNQALIGALLIKPTKSLSIIILSWFFFKLVLPILFKKNYDNPYPDAKLCVRYPYLWKKKRFSSGLVKYIDRVRHSTNKHTAVCLSKDKENHSLLSLLDFCSFFPFFWNFL